MTWSRDAHWVMIDSSTRHERGLGRPAPAAGGLSSPPEAPLRDNLMFISTENGGLSCDFRRNRASLLASPLHGEWRELQRPVIGPPAN